MTSEEIAVAAVKVAAQLVVTVREEGPEAVAEVLAGAPEGRVDAVAIALAAMIDPDALSPSRALAWTELMAPGSPAWTEHRRLVRAGVTEPQASLLAEYAVLPVPLEQLVIRDDHLDLDPVFGASLIGLPPEERKRRIRERERHHAARIDPAGHRERLAEKAATRPSRAKARPQPVHPVDSPVDNDAKGVYLRGEAGERPARDPRRAAS